ncbi:hypoxanthine phosphoribosyltransferase [Psychrobium sp. 1_MG-2023]|uniref:hypoxanthine phosphoribosyltransferase n=1 Tax=Psychrobium sp. 1_MG-2023 TaxID=3062624 RepID=UPI0012917879|nr:hypoxanthine phosphoribosyltransferase [Psychrobium sp. 1_MG-2023]MDP2561477.1 hypoxanthine phosphoribosyltransferase [Psychrobium sp. 1_MG-2023]
MRTSYSQNNDVRLKAVGTTMMKHTTEVMISEQQITDKVAEIGQRIEQHYQDSDNLLLVALLRGSVVFLADLCRQIDLPLSLDFMTVSSYGSSMESTRDVKILKDLTENIKGRDVIIVEDIIDTGNTLAKIVEILSLRQPKSLKLCTLLDKPSRREVDVDVDWIGYSIPDEFVVGYGIDYAEKYRNLPYIAKVIPLQP